MAEKQTVSEKSISCKWCGKTHQTQTNFNAQRDKHWNLCKKNGHYAKVCRSRGISEVNMTRDEQESDIEFLGTVSTEQNDSPLADKTKRE